MTLSTPTITLYIQAHAMYKPAVIHFLIFYQNKVTDKYKQGQASKKDVISTIFMSIARSKLM